MKDRKIFRWASIRKSERGGITLMDQRSVCIANKVRFLESSVILLSFFHNMILISCGTFIRTSKEEMAMHQSNITEVFKRFEFLMKPINRKLQAVLSVLKPFSFGATNAHPTACI